MDVDEGEVQPASFKPMKRESVADLREKLHARIEELRKGRKAVPYMERSPKDALLHQSRKDREREERENIRKQKARNEVSSPTSKDLWTERRTEIMVSRRSN